jgi:hypothetical protein
MDTFATAAGTTVTAASARRIWPGAVLLPFGVAVIVAEPVFTAVTVPLSLTSATSVLLLTHVIVR